MIGRRRFASLLLLTAAGWLPAALAQQPPPRPPPPGDDRPARPPPGDDDRRPRRPGDRPDRLRPPPRDRPDPGEEDGLGFGFDRRFGPNEADFGPLRPGEERALLDFVARHAPPVFQNLQRLKDGGPQEFRDAVEEIAPRLRFLRRLHAENPQLARGILQLAEVQQRLRRLRREFQAAPGARPRLVQAARQELGEAVRLQQQVMRLRAEDLVEHRERYLSSDFDRLTQPDAELTGEPEAIAALVRRHASATDETRAGIADELRQALGRRLDDEIADMQRATQRRRERAPAEIERRLRAMFGDPEKRERP